MKPILAYIFKEFAYQEHSYYSTIKATYKKIEMTFINSWLSGYGKALSKNFSLGEYMGRSRWGQIGIVINQNGILKDLLVIIPLLLPPFILVQFIYIATWVILFRVLTALLLIALLLIILDFFNENKS